MTDVPPRFASFGAVLRLRDIRAGGASERLQAAAVVAMVLVGAALAAVPVLWLIGALDEVQWSGDFITAVTIAVVVYGAITVGFVVARPRALLIVWLLSMVWILIEELRWNEASTGSGIDDMSPIAALPFSPLFMVFPAIGLWIADRIQQRSR